jgi:hypothetical protein
VAQAVVVLLSLMELHRQDLQQQMELQARVTQVLHLLPIRVAVVVALLLLHLESQAVLVLQLTQVGGM